MYNPSFPPLNQAPEPSSVEPDNVKLPFPNTWISPPASATRVPLPALKFDFSILRFDPSDVIAPPAIPNSPLPPAIVNVESVTFALLQFSNLIAPPVLNGPGILNFALLITATVLVASIAPP